MFLVIVLVCCNEVLESFWLAVNRGCVRTSVPLSQLAFAINKFHITHIVHVLLTQNCKTFKVDFVWFKPCLPNLCYCATEGKRCLKLGRTNKWEHDLLKKLKYFGESSLLILMIFFIFFSQILGE